MSVKHVASTAWHYFRAGMVSLALLQYTVGASLAAALPSQASRDAETRSPIKHVIVIIGENRSFDHVFATYVPKRGESVWNLLSEGIVKANGAPGPNFFKAEQLAAKDAAPDAFQLSPEKQLFQHDALPAPLVGGPKDSYITGDSLTLAQQSENGLPSRSIRR